MAIANIIIARRTGVFRAAAIAHFVKVVGSRWVFANKEIVVAHERVAPLAIAAAVHGTAIFVALSTLWVVGFAQIPRTAAVISAVFAKYSPALPQALHPRAVVIFASFPSGT